jgi:hypothetical protein
MKNRKKMNQATLAWFAVSGAAILLLALTIIEANISSRSVRKGLVTQTRLDINRILDAKTSVTEDREIIAVISSHLRKGDFTTADLGIEEHGDFMIHLNWVSRLRVISTVNEADRAVCRIFKLQDQVVKEGRVATESEIREGQRQLSLVLKGQQLVTPTSPGTQLTLGPIKGDPTVRWYPGASSPETTHAKLCLEALKSQEIQHQPSFLVALFDKMRPHPRH